MEAVPTPPPLPQHTRYPVRLIVQAREMYGDGDAWTPTQIRDYLADRHDLPHLHVNTVRRWVIPAEADVQRQRNAECARKRRRRASGGPAEAPPFEPGELADRQLDKRIRELRDLGLTYGAITIVLRAYHGVNLSEEKVRYRALKGGAPKNPRKARALRERHLRAA